jgi:hypothetical protein
VQGRTTDTFRIQMLGQRPSTTSCTRRSSSDKIDTTAPGARITKMAIIIRDVTDADLVRACEIEGAAYADSPLSPVLFPGPFPPEAKRQRVPLLIEMRNNDATAQYLQAYDEETGQLIAFAKWHVYDSPEAAATAFQPSRIFGPGANKEACEEFFTGLTSKKNELIGDRAHLCKLLPSSVLAHVNSDRPAHAPYRSSFPRTGRRRTTRRVGCKESGRFGPSGVPRSDCERPPYLFTIRLRGCHVLRFRRRKIRWHWRILASTYETGAFPIRLRRPYWDQMEASSRKQALRANPCAMISRTTRRYWHPFTQDYIPELLSNNWLRYCLFQIISPQRYVFTFLPESPCDAILLNIHSSRNVSATKLSLPSSPPALIITKQLLLYSSPLQLPAFFSELNIQSANSIRPTPALDTFDGLHHPLLLQHTHHRNFVSLHGTSSPPADSASVPAQHRFE